MRVKKNLMRGGAYLMASLIFVGMTARTALETNRNVVDGFLGTKSYYVETDTSSGELYTTFTADYTNTSDLVAAHEAMGEQLMEEGAVLLKNNGALPLSDSQRNVTLLGIRSDAKTLYGATIGVNVPSEQNVSLTTALEEKGFSVNATMNSVYETLVQEDAFSKDVNKVSASFSGVLPGQEAQYVGAEPTASDFAKENFDTVIVLINAVNVMELGDLETDDGVDAVLWIGFPGNYGRKVL
jgi:beta-glucosidase